MVQRGNSLDVRDSLEFSDSVFSNIELPHVRTNLLLTVLVGLVFEVIMYGPDTLQNQLRVLGDCRVYISTFSKFISWCSIKDRLHALKNGAFHFWPQEPTCGKLVSGLEVHIQFTGGLWWVWLGPPLPPPEQDNTTRNQDHDYPDHQQDHHH
mmetsp:Transcript_58507/g.130796  ORF Transcript_58507/g.130796 Transcript_58507/m.130796 type:complete len:152 (+) Transcript_58507:933-1388(+)